MADNFGVLTATGSSIDIASKELSSGIHAPKHVQVDTSGNIAPVGDAAARASYVIPTNGTQTMPSGDAAARPIYVTPVPNAANGGSLHTTRGLVGTPVAVKASAGVLHGLIATNNHSSACFLQIFNVASGSVTPGTTTPALEVYLPANTTKDFNLGASGLTMDTAISMIATTTRMGATGTQASTCDVTIGYK